MHVARRGETGVVAVIVALSVSTFLLGFAALAVDLGSAYARQTDVQATAEQLARAGAAGLPDIATALNDLERARVQMCVGEDLPGICDVTNMNWMQDGDLSNGEVRFYDDQGQAGMFADLEPPAGLDPNDFLAYSATKAVGIRVQLPPSRVQFGLAGAIGFSGVDISRAATARLGTPLGAGILPFALKQEDLARGQFCIRDPSVSGGATVTPPTGDPSFPVTDTTFPVGRTTATKPGGQTFDLTLKLTNTALPPRVIQDNNVDWHIRTADDPDEDLTIVQRPGLIPPQALNTWIVTVPAQPPNTTVYIWATGTSRSWFGGRPRAFTSQPFTVIFSGTSDEGLCREPASNRGFVNLARTSGNGLTDNVRQGPQTKLYDSTTPLGAQILGSTVDCVSRLFAPSTACLSQNLTDSWSSQVRAGLLTGSGNVPGRLNHDCGNGTAGVQGGSVDSTHLIDGSTSNPLIDGRSPQDLRNRILTGGQNAGNGDGYTAVISSVAMRCGRLAVMPVIEPFSVAGVTLAQRITKFVYVWIDYTDASRGLNFARGGQLASVRGYVLEPALFPAEVAGSPVVGPYLGDDMPEQVVLVHDLGSRGT